MITLFLFAFLTLSLFYFDIKLNLEKIKDKLIVYESTDSDSE